MTGGQEKRRDRKAWKNRNEEEVFGFTLASLFPARKREAVTLGWNHLITGIDHLTRKRTQGAGIVKGWEDKQDRGRIPDTFT